MGHGVEGGRPVGAGCPAAAPESVGAADACREVGRADARAIRRSADDGALAAAHRARARRGVQPVECAIDPSPPGSGIRANPRVATRRLVTKILPLFPSSCSISPTFLGLGTLARALLSALALGAAAFTPAPVALTAALPAALARPIDGAGPSAS